MAKESLLGVYPTVEVAADAVSRLYDAGFTTDDVEVLSDTPYPEGAFGEPPAQRPAPDRVPLRDGRVAGRQLALDLSAQLDGQPGRWCHEAILADAADVAH